jgi:hypothetical protein
MITTAAAANIPVLPGADAAGVDATDAGAAAIDGGWMDGGGVLAGRTLASSAIVGAAAGHDADEGTTDIDTGCTSSCRSPRSALTC